MPQASERKMTQSDRLELRKKGSTNDCVCQIQYYRSVEHFRDYFRGI